MNPLSYVATADAGAALREIGGPLAASAFIAGGTNLLDLMKENLTRPARLVDISRIALAQVERTDDGALMLGALARNADTAYHPLVRAGYPMLTAAILAGASAQIRNMASNGGNLLQRTRCIYFYDAGLPCNKRRPGSGCPAIAGITRQHAILGASEHCIATHPSDMCVALAALGAYVHVQSAGGTRRIAFADLHRLPGAHPEHDTTLAHGDLITQIELPPANQYRDHSAYLKLRDRASYAFALVSVAAALELDDSGDGAVPTIRSVRVALGGVAHKPWRLPDAEAQLAGAPANTHSYARLADALLSGAIGQGENDFKITLAHRAVVRALHLAAAGTQDNTGEHGAAGHDGELQ